MALFCAGLSTAWFPGSATLAQEDALITEFRVIEDRALVRVANTSEAYFVFVVATNLLDLEAAPDQATVIGRRSALTDFFFNNTNAALGTFFFSIRSNANCDPVDNDGDGVDDVIESLLPYLDPTVASDGAEDPDGDGWDTRTELYLGTNPDDPADFYGPLTRTRFAPEAGTVIYDGGFTLNLIDAMTTPLTPAGGGRAGAVWCNLSEDAYSDLASVDPFLDRLIIHLGQPDGTIAETTNLPSGAAGPLAVEALDWVGDASIDLAVGHADGRVTVFEGDGAGGLIPRPDLTVSNLGAVVALAADDFDGDGDTDLAVSGGNAVTLLFNDNDPAGGNPVANGEFAFGLNGWTPSGQVSVQAGKAVFEERGGFLSILEQTIVLPPGPQTLSFDLLDARLGSAPGELPDAFEVSLLDGAGGSLLPSFRVDAESLFNRSGTLDDRLAASTGISSNRVTVDLTSLAGGTAATVRFALVGSPGPDSLAAIDNVSVTPDAVYAETVTASALPGPFGNTGGLVATDMNGDGIPDLLVEDGGLGTFLLFQGQGSGTFARIELAAADYGCPPSPPLPVGSTGAVEQAKYFVADGLTWQVNPYLADGTPRPAVTPAAGTQPRAIETSPDGSRTWLVHEDGQTIWVYDANLNPLGSWTPDGASNVFDLAVAGTDLWALDRRFVFIGGDPEDPENYEEEFRMLRYAGEASRTAGAASPAGAWVVPSAVTAPRYVVSDGLELRILDAAAGRVYRLNLGGTLLGSWALDPQNANPRGLARSGADLFIADRDDLVVYRYDSGMTYNAGTGSASVAFALAGSNLEPVDISDPVVPIDLDTLIEDAFATGSELLEYSFSLAPPAIGVLFEGFYADGAFGEESFFDPFYQIDDPGGSNLIDTFFWDRGPTILSATGTHQLTIYSPDQSTGAVGFVLRSFDPGPAVTLTSDVLTVGSTAVTGEIDRFSVTVTNPSALVLSFSDGNGTLSWRLADSNETTVGQSAWYDDGFVYANQPGTYWFDIWDFVDNTGDYSFTLSVTDLGVPSNLVLGVTASNSFSAVPAVHAYNATLTNGMVVHVDLLSNDDFGYYWRLVSPSGSNLFEEFLADESPVFITETGVHTLYVESDSTLGGYSFALRDVTPSPEPLTLGTATTGTFASGEARLYEWTATSNQFLYINRISMSGQYEWELLSPTGRVIYETFFFSNGPYTFDTTGTYSLALYARDGSSGSVTFSIDELLVQPETPPVPIELNTNITATVTNAFWSNRYTFVLSQPNTLIFDRTSGSSSQFGWRLLDPSSNEVFDSSMFDRSPEFYAATGTYELAVYSRNASVPASYGFEIIAPSPPPPVETFFLDTVVTSTIAEPFQIRRYDIDLAQGQRVKARTLVGSRFDFDWFFYDPATNFVFGGQFDDESLYLAPTTGTYRLELTGDGSETGTVEFVFLEVPPDPAPEPLVLDQVYSPLMYPGLTFTYTLAVTSPVTIYFDELEGSNGTVFAIHQLTDPQTNAVFGPISSNDRGPFTLTEPGTYTLRMTGSDSGDITNYFFKVWNVPENAPSPLAFSVTARAVLAIPGEVVTYTFAGEAGEAIYLENLFGYDTFSIRVVDPSGAVLGSVEADTDLDTVTLATGGVHRIEVFYDGFASDSFNSTNSFRLWKVLEGEPRPIAVGDVVNASLPSPRGTSVFTFEADAGDVLFFDRQTGPGSVGSNNGFTWELQGPSSTTLFSTNYTDLAGIAIAETGTHTLRVTGGFSANTPYFQFKIWNWEPLTRSIAYGAAVSDYLSAPGLTNRYLFDATAGDTIVLDAVVGGGAAWRLIDPTQAQVASSGGGNLSHTAALTGTYEIHVVQSFAGNNHEQHRYAFQLDNGILPLALPPVADLAATGVAAPPVVISTAAVVEVTWTVTNTATNATASSGWTDRIYLSCGTTVFGRGDEWYIDVPRVGGLAANAAYTATHAVALPPGFEGEFRVHVVADSTNVEFESDEGDNLSAGFLISVYPEARNLGNSPAIEVNLADGARFPKGETLVLNGAARAVAASENLFVVFDVSGSAFFVTGFDVNQDGVIDDRDNVNNDDFIGSSFDVQIAALQRLEEALAATGTDLRVIPVIWAAQAFPADIAPDAFVQNYFPPGADRNGNGQPDILESLLSVDYFDFFLTSRTYLNGFTYYDMSPGNNLQQMVESLVTRIDQAPPVGRNRVFFFVDAGPATNGDADTNTVLSLASRGISFEAFQFIDPAPVAPETQRLADLIDSDPASSGRATVLEQTEDLVRRVTESLAVAGVTVNGVGAESVDSSGRFFSRYTVQPGTQTVTVAAYDTRGVSVSRTYTIVGYDPNDTNDVALADLGSALELTYPGLSWRESDDTVVADAAVVNRGVYPQRSPFEVRILGIEPAGASIVSPDRTEPDGTPVLAFDPYGLDLAPGATGAVRQAEIANPGRGRVRLTAALYGRPNAAPRFTTVPPASVAVSNLWAYTAEIIDDDGDPVTLTLLERPEGMTVDSNTLSWMPGSGEVGYHSLRLRAEDDRGGRAEQVFRILVEDAAGNRPPVFYSVPPTELASGLDYLYVPDVRDADGDALSFALVGSPPGFSVDPTNGTVAYAAISDGTYALELEADDGNDGIAIQRFDLSVGIASTNPSAPVILTTPPTVAVVGETYLYFPAAYDPDGDPVTFSLPTAPAGMTIGSNTGHIAWIPATNQVGPHTVLLRAEDDGGLFASQFFTITVATSAVNRLPVITSTPAGFATEGEPYTALVAAEDPEALPITFALELAPSGLTLDTNSGAIAWTPAPGSAGIATARVSAIDVEGAAAYLTWFIDVRASNTPPAFTRTPASSVVEGATYRGTVAADDAEDAVRYELTDGPAGLTVDPVTGLLLWDTEPGDAGTYPVTITAVDDRDLARTLAFTLAVTPDTASPVVSLTASPVYLNAGETSVVSVAAIDDVEVVSLGLFLDGTNAVPLTGGVGEVVPPAPGLWTVEGIAVDAAGNTGTFSAVIRAFDPADTNEPVIVITAPSNQTVVATTIAIEGSITDPGDNLDYYTLEIARASGLERIEQPGGGFALDLGCDGCFTELVRVSTSSVSGVLGTIDTTVYPNDDYALRVTAFDVNGRGRTEGVVISVQGQVKPGQFTLEITDISIPTRGLPIEIIRRYDSLKRDDLDAFGFGWSLHAADPDIRETVRDETLPYSPFSLYPLYVGARVYLNDPDGYRVGYTFDVDPAEFTLIGSLYAPRFDPDPGVFDALEDARDDMRVTLRDGEARWPLVSIPYNPAEYRLTRRDGSIYLYDQQEGLVQVTDRFSNTVTYADTAIAHSDGFVLTLQRDELGRIATISSTAGVLTAYAYDAAGNLRTVTDAENRTTTYLYFDEPPHALRAIIGPDGRILHEAEFDEAGRMVRQTGGGDTGVERTYDADTLTGVNRDEYGRESVVTYTSNLLVGRVDLFDGTVIEYGYDDQDRIVSETVDGATRSFAYDDNDQLLSISNALGEVWAYTYNADRIDTMTDPMGRAVSLAVSDQDRITGVGLPGGGVRTLQYDDQGRLTNRIDELGQAIAMTYGALTVPEELRWDDGSSRQFSWRADGRLESIVDEAGYLTFFEMNDAGSITQVVDHAGHTTRMSFDGRSPIVSSWTDADGETFRREDVLDATGFQTGMRYLFPNGETVAVQVVAGIPEAITNVIGPGVSNTWAISESGSTTTVTDAEGRVSEFVIRNELIRAYTDRLGRERIYRYDLADRLTQVVWKVGGQVANDIRLVYNAAGYPIRVSDFVATYTYTRDSNQWLTGSASFPSNGLPPFSIAYTYDAKGNLVGSADSLGVAVTSRYDVKDDLVGRDWAWPGQFDASVAVDRDPRGLPVRMERYASLTSSAPSVVTRMTWNYARDLSDLVHEQGASSNLLASYEYRFTPARWVTQEVRNTGTLVIDHDPIGQVLSVQGAPAPDESFVWQDGNPVGSNSLVGMNNRLLRHGDYAMTYDLEGNMTSRSNLVTGASLALTWDVGNRLVRIEERDGAGNLVNTVDYVVDAFGRRLARTLNGTNAFTVYDFAMAHADLDASSNVVAVYLNSDLADQRVGRYRPADGIHWYLADRMQNVRHLANAAGSVAGELQYLTFGQPVVDTAPGVSDRFQWAGRPYEEVGGFYDFYFRTYDPVLGRFTSPDPIRYALGEYNVYRYAFNNPLDEVDLLGLGPAIEYPWPLVIQSFFVGCVISVGESLACDGAKALGKGLAAAASGGGGGGGSGGKPPLKEKKEYEKGGNKATSYLYDCVIGGAISAASGGAAGGAAGRGFKGMAKNYSVYAHQLAVNRGVRRFNQQAVKDALSKGGLGYSAGKCAVGAGMDGILGNNKPPDWFTKPFEALLEQGLLK